MSVDTMHEHLDCKKKANVRMDYSSDFSTFVPSKSVLKLKDLGLCNVICWWMCDCLRGRAQTPTHLPVCINKALVNLEVL